MYKMMTMIVVNMDILDDIRFILGIQQKGTSVVMIAKGVPFYMFDPTR
ncbi:hypothetical protein [Paenibacillus amylolyticus]